MNVNAKIHTLRAYNRVSGNFLGEWTDTSPEEAARELSLGFGAPLSDEIFFDRVCYEIHSEDGGVGDGAGPRTFFDTHEEAEAAIPGLAESLDADPEDFYVKRVQVQI